MFKSIAYILILLILAYSKLYQLVLSRLAHGIVQKRLERRTGTNEYQARGSEGS